MWLCVTWCECCIKQTNKHHHKKKRREEITGIVGEWMSVWVIYKVPFIAGYIVYRRYSYIVSVPTTIFSDIFITFRRFSICLQHKYIRCNDTSGFKRAQQHALFPPYHITIYICSFSSVCSTYIYISVYFIYMCNVQCSCSCANAIELVLHTSRELRVQLTNSG